MKTSTRFLHLLMGFAAALVFLAACTPSTGPATPSAGPVTDIAPPTPTPSPIIGNGDPAGPGLTEPPPAALQIGQARQTAAVGSYCWPGGPGEPGICLDKVGIPSPKNPLPVESPLIARFELPLEDPPSVLVLRVRGVTPDEEMAETAEGYRWWPPGSGEDFNLPLQSRVQSDLALEPGLHLLQLFAAWEGVGDATYGFLIEVSAIATGGFPALPADISAVVTVADQVSLYAGPGETYGEVATVFGGLIWPVTGVSEDGMWWRLSCSDDQGQPVPECWASADPAVTAPLQADPTLEPAVVASVPYVEVLTSATLNLRAAPRLDSDIIGSLRLGELHEVTGASEDGAWWRLRCLNGTIGDCWISADLRFSQPTPFTDLILEGLVVRPADRTELEWVTGSGALTDLFDPGVGLAALSPDGREALRCCTRDEDDLRRVDLATGATVQLTDTPTRYDFNPQWWPSNEDQVLFLSRAFDPVAGPGSPGPANLAVAALDGSGHQILDNEGLVYTLPAGGPDGRTIAYDRGDAASAQDGLLEPWLLDLRESAEPFDFEAYGLRPVPNLSFGSPTWSPDGALLAWVVAGDLEETGKPAVGLAVFDLEGRSVQVRVSHEPANLPFVWGPPPPRWSPDGRWIAWQGSPSGSLPGFWIIQVEGDDEIFFERADSPTWSPDGRHLAFSKRSRIFIFEAGIWEQELTDLPEGAALVDWLQPVSVTP